MRASGVFSFQGVRQGYFAKAILELFLVNAPDPLQVFSECGNQGIGEHAGTVVFAFAIADDQLGIIEIKILVAPAQTFHQAQSTAVEQLGHQFGCTLHVAGDRQGFLFTEHAGQVAGFLGTKPLRRKGRFWPGTWR